MQHDSLEQFVESVSGTSHLRVEYEFGGGFVRLHTSEAERRQALQDIRSSEDIVIELLRNARDAHASHIFVASTKEGTLRKLVVIDDGDGIPQDMHLHIFEPRVTSKLDTAHKDKWGMHGRGMALYSVHENAQEAYVANSGIGLGTSIVITSDTTTLPEKADQSTFPSFILEDSGKVSVRGPKNLIRLTSEFAIEERAACSVYFGTPTEILATLYEFGSATLSAIDRAFCRNIEELPLVKRLATAGDPDTFASIAYTLGLSISSRSARRILDGQIDALDALIDRIMIQLPSQPRMRSGKKSSTTLAHTVKISAEDKDEMARQMEDAYKAIAQRYYLAPNVEATTRIARGKIIVSIPLVPDTES